MFFHKESLLAVIFLQFGFFTPVFGEEKEPVLQTIQQEPYGFINAEGQLDGYLYKVAKLIMEEAGYKSDPQAVPVKRLIKNLKTGSTSCALAANSPFAQKHFMLVEGIGHDIDVGYMPRKDLNLEKYEDLQGLRVAIPAGMTIGDPFDNDTTLLKVKTPDYKRGVLLLSRGDIDVLVGVIESIKYSTLISEKEASLLWGEPLVVKSFTMSLICGKEHKNSEMVYRLKKATIKLKEAGVFAQVISEFFNRDPLSN